MPFPGFEESSFEKQAKIEEEMLRADRIRAVLRAIDEIPQGQLSKLAAKLLITAVRKKAGLQ